MTRQVLCVLKRTKRCQRRRWIDLIKLILPILSIMNTLRHPAQKASVVAVGRHFSAGGKHGPVQPLFQMFKSSNAGIKNPLVPEVYQYSLKKAFFSDSATYPLIVVLVGTSAFIVGMTINALKNNKDIKINTDHKHQVVRDWGEKPTKTFAKRIPLVGWNAKKYETLSREGLGVDHAEWLKAKHAENKPS